MTSFPPFRKKIKRGCMQRLAGPRTEGASMPVSWAIIGMWMLLCHIYAEHTCECWATPYIINGNYATPSVWTASWLIWSHCHGNTIQNSNFFFARICWWQADRTWYETDLWEEHWKDWFISHFLLPGGGIRTMILMYVTMPPYLTSMVRISWNIYKEDRNIEVLNCLTSY